MKLKSKKTDYFFVVLVFLLVIFGLMMLASASSESGKTRFNDSYYYLKHQFLYGLSLGLLLFFISANVDYRRWEKYSLFFLIISLVLLLLVFSPWGVLKGGAQRWLAFGAFTFQPSEVIKLTFFVYLASWLSRDKKRAHNFFSGFLPFLFVFALVVGLLLFQRSTSAAVIIGVTTLVVYFLGGARFRFILALLLAGFAILPIVISLTPYRLERIKTFLNPAADPLGTGYHLNQCLLAIGSGKLWGRGYGQSIAKIRYLPEPIGDSIFAVIAEEFGFIGASGLVIVFFLLLWRIFLLFYRGPDDFARLLATSFGLLLGMQVFIHIAALTGLIPLTGVPLPFISYGGTALAVFLTMVGILTNISKYGQH